MTTLENTPFTEVTKGGETTIQEESGTGSKYDRNLDIAEIAKLIRKELADKFPKKEGWKFSVKIDRYSMGQAMDVTIKEIPEGIFVYDAEWFQACLNGAGHCIADALRYTEQWEEKKAEIKAIINQYNYNNSDSMTDYFDVNFYENVQEDSDIRNYYRKSFELLYGEFNF